MLIRLIEALIVYLIILQVFFIYDSISGLDKVSLIAIFATITDYIEV